MASVQLRNETQQAVAVGDRVFPPCAVFEVAIQQPKDCCQTDGV